jgi:SAM-dependent methyltransferase
MNRCTACGSTRPPTSVRGENEFVRCADCGLLQRSHAIPPPEMQTVLETLYQALPLQEAPDPDHPEVVSESTFLFAYFPRIRPDMRALDVGSGTGNLLASFKRNGIAAVGIEPYAPHARIARGAGFDVHVGRFDRSIKRVFADNSFDIVSFGDTINYMDDQGEALELAHDLLRPDGILFISCHVVSSPYYWRSAPLIGRVGANATVFYERRTLVGALKRHGFVVAAAGRQSVLVAHAIEAWGLKGLLARVAGRILPAIVRYLPADCVFLVARPRMPNNHKRLT